MREFSYSEFKTDNRNTKIRNVLERRQPDLTIVLENVHDPHNVSAVFRSCDAVGVFEVCLVYHSGQVFPQLGERSSASARKWVGSRVFESISDCYDELRKEGKKIYSTHMGQSSIPLYELNLKEPVALVFGNEHKGVSEEAASLADGNFLIPQVGMIQSLNISVACAVSLYEAFRQRLASGLYDKVQFEAERFNILLEDWLRR